MKKFDARASVLFIGCFDLKRAFSKGHDFREDIALNRMEPLGMHKIAFNESLNAAITSIFVFIKYMTHIQHHSIDLNFAN